MYGYSPLGYALSYGGAGLGLVMNLNVLGVSRDYELEADQLGIQYVWRAGYDPDGFIRFFDRMASEKGYASGSSWFRTHPAFYERMVKAKAELAYLPQKNNLITQTNEFSAMQEELKKIPAPPPSPQEMMQQRPVYPKVENCPANPQSTDEICDLPAGPGNQQAGK
jgi:predicted Zn-dependent protease